MTYGEKNEKFHGNTINPNSPFGLTAEQYAATQTVVETQSKVCGHPTSSVHTVPRKLYDKVRDSLQRDICQACRDKGLTPEDFEAPTRPNPLGPQAQQEEASEAEAPIRVKGPAFKKPTKKSRGHSRRPLERSPE